MNFIEPTAGELASLRADPVIFEQELDCRPGVAESLERVLGFRCGRKYWRSKSGYLYALELGDFGRGRPSMAFVYGFWARYEPRPADTEIDSDLMEFALWMAGACDGLDPEDVKFVFAQVAIIHERAL
jgi:hypothetical protein